MDKYNIGRNAGSIASGDAQNTNIGDSAGQLNTDVQNVFLGNNAGWSSDSNSSNVFFGYNAGQKFNGNSSVLIGANVAGSGVNASEPTPGGNGNVFIGSTSGFYSNGSKNTFTGYSTGRNTTGDNNCFYGFSSGITNLSGSGNSFYGVYSGNLSKGINNTFIGYGSGTNITTGSNNTFLGIINNAPVGVNNTIILGDGSTNQRLYIDDSGRTGVDLGTNPSIGNRLEINATGVNTIAGTAGLRFRGFPNTSATTPNLLKKVLSVNGSGDVILVDDQVGPPGVTNNCQNINFVNKTDNTGNHICSQIFDNYRPSFINAFGVLIPSNINNSNVCIGTDVAFSSSFFNFTQPPSGFPLQSMVGQQGSVKLDVRGLQRVNGLFTTSDESYKENIAPIKEALEKVLKLQGKTYSWKVNDYPQMNFDKLAHSGFIAQEVETVLPHLVVTGDDDEKYGKGKKSVNYIELIPFLVESIKALNERINGLDAQIQCLNEATGCNSIANKSSNVLPLEYTKIISASPNPSNDVVSISIAVEKSMQSASLNVYDINGKLINSLTINERSANIVRTFQKDNFGAGVYIVSLIANGKPVDSKKIIFN